VPTATMAARRVPRDSSGRGEWPKEVTVVFMLFFLDAVAFRWVDCRRPGRALPIECDGMQVSAMKCRKASVIGDAALPERSSTRRSNDNMAGEKSHKVREIVAVAPRSEALNFQFLLEFQCAPRRFLPPL
jgi:hypothetical protein